MPQNPKKATRLERALRVRDRVLPYVNCAGELRGSGNDRFVEWGWSTIGWVMLRTPSINFEDFQQDQERRNRLIATGYASSPLMSYAMDVIGAQGKLMNLEWEKDGAAQLVSFKRGDWDQFILSDVPPFPRPRHAI